jgi:competence protein ComEC
MIFGIIFGFYFNPNSIIVIGFLIVLLAFLFVFYKISDRQFNPNYYFNLFAYLLFFVIGIASVSLQNVRFQKNHYSHHISTKNTVVLSIEKRLKSNLYYDKYEAIVQQINQQKTNGKIVLNIQKDSLSSQLQIGNTLFIKSNFKIINKPLNLFQFNYKKYLEKQQIYHQITTKNSEIKFLKYQSNFTGTLAKKTANFRDKINSSLKKYHFKNDELAIINALLLGQRQDISKELLQNYAGAGAMHILAVSGLHIGIILLLLNALFKPIEQLKNGKTIKLVLVVLLLWCYAFIAGFSASIIRAVAMFTAIAIGLLSNKKTNTLHNLFISMFFLLLINPLYLFRVGFQLSYLAVFSIVYLYPLFTRFYNPKNWFLRKTWQLFAISLSAQIGILPLSLYYFHQFPSLFFVSSLVIIPLLGFILGFGIFIITFALLGILPQFLANSYGFIISKMNAFIAFIAKQEDFLFQNISFSILLLIASYLIIIFGFRWVQNRTFKKLIIAMLAVIFFQSVLIYEKQQEQSKSEFVVFHKNKESILVNRNGTKASIIHSLDSSLILKNNSLKDYKIGIGKLNLNYNPIKNTYRIGNENLLIIDSLGIYNIPKFYPEMVLLRQSPKINLERLIALIKPKIIIADGSNYKSYKKRWKKTCLKYQIEFYDTSINGAFVIKY